MKVYDSSHSNDNKKKRKKRNKENFKRADVREENFWKIGNSRKCCVIRAAWRVVFLTTWWKGKWTAG